MRCVSTAVALIVSFLWSASLLSQVQSKSKKHPLPPPLPPLPVGSTGPLPQMPLDSMSQEPPQVYYRDGKLTIIAGNSTLTDILRCVREQTGAEIEIPATNERVVTHLGPGPVSDVLSELLNGSHFNYVLLGSPGDPTHLTRVVLLAKTVPDGPTPAQAAAALNAVPPARSAVLARQPQPRLRDDPYPNHPEGAPNPDVTPSPPQDPSDNSD